MGHHCCKAIYEKAIHSRLGRGELVYAALADQLLGVRDRPGRLRGVRVFGAVWVSISGTAIVSIEAPRFRPRPGCFARPDRRSE